MSRNKIGYNGKQYDPVAGIYNYGFRDYTARLAQFTTIDPIKDGINWYAYCGNDPVNFVDPLGLEMKITGTSTFQAQTLDNMQKLTRDTLDIKK